MPSGPQRLKTHAVSDGEGAQLKPCPFDVVTVLLGLRIFDGVMARLGL